MLRLIWVLICLLFTLEVFACLRLEGSFAIDGETLKIDQQAKLGQEYSLPFQSFILSLTLHPDPKSSKAFNLKYKVEERMEKSLEMVSAGVEEISVGDEREIYAKGLGKKPHSILDLKLKEI